MTTIANDISTAATIRDNNAQTVERLMDGENAIDRWMIRWSDRLSPIVVKETRQSLKSKQFVWTFIFLLLAILGWTLLGIVSLMPGVYYFPAGQTMLAGYLIMLFVPALVIVPTNAFFSMAGELNSNTFDVLSITPLSSHKIVLGKVIVAAVQLLIYLSALAPCIALTYLLRGVSISNLGLVFPIVASSAFLVTTIGVMLGTFCRTSLQLVFFLFIQLAVSLFAFIYTTTMVFALMADGFSDNAWNVLVFLIVPVSYGVLAILVGGASIGIAGENYARSIRIWLAIQSYVFFVVFLFFVNFRLSDALVGGILISLFLHWMFAGVFLVSQSGVITPRMQRKLPQRLSSRIILTWLIPGGGTGYIFTVLNFAAFVAASLYSLMLYNADLEDWLIPPLLLAYLCLYLGLLRLVMMVIPSNVGNRSVLALLLGVFLMALGCGIPEFISLYLSDFSSSDYEFYSFTNPFKTFSNLDRAISMYLPIVLLFLSAFFVFCLNAILISGDIVLVRIQTFDDAQAGKSARGPEVAADPFAAD